MKKIKEFVVRYEDGTESALPLKHECAIMTFYGLKEVGDLTGPLEKDHNGNNVILIMDCQQQLLPYFHKNVVPEITKIVNTTYHGS